MPVQGSTENQITEWTPCRKILQLQKFVCMHAGVCFAKSDLYFKCMYVYTLDGQMAEYFICVCGLM